MPKTEPKSKQQQKKKPKLGEMVNELARLLF